MVPQDVFDVAPDVLRHRLVLSYEALAAGRHHRPRPGSHVVDGSGPTSDRGRPDGPGVGRVSPPPSVAGERPEVVLRRLELAVTRRLDGLLHGDYRGLARVRASEIGEAREYSARRRRPPDGLERDGPDRSRPTSARPCADRELETWMLVDQSASLYFGTASTTKRDLAVAAASAIGFLTSRTGNRIGGALLGRRSEPHRPTAAGAQPPARPHAPCDRRIEPTEPAPPTSVRASPARRHRPPPRPRRHHQRLPDHRSVGGAAEGARSPTGRAGDRGGRPSRTRPARPRRGPPGGGSRDGPAPARSRPTPGRSVGRIATPPPASAPRSPRPCDRPGPITSVLRTDGDWLTDLVKFVAQRRDRIDHRKRAQS